MEKEYKIAKDYENKVKSLNNSYNLQFVIKKGCISKINEETTLKKLAVYAEKVIILENEAFVINML